MGDVMKFSTIIAKAMDSNISFSIKIEKALKKIGLELRYKKNYMNKLISWQKEDLWE